MPDSATTHLLYLHGFRSSPESFKSRLMAQWLAQHRPDVQWWCPQLPPSPRAAVALVLDGTRHWPANDIAMAGSAVVGSSLGGFYATAVAEARGWPAVLLNPAVHPERDLQKYIGTQTMFHAPEQTFEVRAEFIDELRALKVAQITRPQRYAAVIAKGDEVLDWREMQAAYPGARIRLLEGSDHGLSNFAADLPWVLRFLGWQTG